MLVVFILFNNMKPTMMNTQVRAVPGGYFTGLINDMHKDLQHFEEKGTFLQMEYLDPSIKQNSPTFESINRSNDERKLEKLRAPRTLNPLSMQCTLPLDYRELENLSSLVFLTKYAKPSVSRQHVIHKLIRKIQSETTIDIDDAKEIMFEYFNHYRKRQEIDEVFHFLNIDPNSRLQSKDIVIICCYAERYFLSKLCDTKSYAFERPLQEVIDFEFLKRKLDGLKLSEDLRNLIATLQGSDRKNI